MNRLRNKLIRITARLALVCALLSFNGKNTCKREGRFHGSSDIKTSGTVVLQKTRKNKLYLKLKDDFKTQDGPDLDVYLSQGKQVRGKLSIRLEPLFIIEGPQQYKLPDSISMISYNYVVIHCTRYNHWYGYAELGEVIGECN